MASGMASPRSSSIRLRTSFVCSEVKKSFWSGKEGITNHVTTPNTTVMRPSMTYRQSSLGQNSGNRAFNTPTKIHLQPASSPLPLRRVQPYARKGPVAAAIDEVKVNTAMLMGCWMIRAEFRTVHWRTASESRGVYTCEMCQLSPQIAKIRYTPSRHQKKYGRVERCLMQVNQAAGTGNEITVEPRKHQARRGRKPAKAKRWRNPSLTAQRPKQWP